VKATNLPLGKNTDYPQNYSPEVLCSIARRDSRDRLGLVEPLPFTGADIWNAWELTWLGPAGLPKAATARFEVPATSPALIESKSLKLYLGSFAMTRFATPADVANAIETDLSEQAGAPVAVSMNPDAPITAAEGRNIDALDVNCMSHEVDAGLLAADRDDPAEEILNTHLLRSLCPVTGQPDIGSLLVAYAGPRIDPEALLRYVVSYRLHEDFHEACVERMFADILERCCPDELTVCARYQRRGGIDINPFRTNAGATPRDRRLWRQ
jgi:7-cyano-7-deazaguanine reductase